MAVMDMKKVAVLLLLSDLSGVLAKRATLQEGAAGKVCKRQCGAVWGKCVAV